MTRKSISDDLLRDLLAVTLKKWNIPWTTASFPSSVQPNPLKGYNMRYLIASIIPVLLNCTIAYSQESRTVVKSTSAPAQTTLAAQGERFGLEVPGNNLNGLPPSFDQLGNQTGDFVFINGAAYMRLGGSLFPISGGGASGCFSLNLPQRIQRINDFIRHVEDRETANQQDHEGKHGLSTSSLVQPPAKIL